MDVKKKHMFCYKNILCNSFLMTLLTCSLLHTSHVGMHVHMCTHIYARVFKIGFHESCLTFKMLSAANSNNNSNSQKLMGLNHLTQ